MINHDSLRMFEAQCRNVVNLIRPRIVFFSWTGHASSTIGGLLLAIFIGTMIINQDILGHCFFKPMKGAASVDLSKNKIWTQGLVHRISQKGIRRFNKGFIWASRYALPKHLYAIQNMYPFWHTHIEGWSCPHQRGPIYIYINIITLYIYIYTNYKASQSWC